MSPDQLSATFSALADPTRRAILARLASGETPVTELAAPFAMTLPAVTKHLKVLQRAGLVTQGRQAQWRPCKLEAAPLRAVSDWVEQYRAQWEQRLDRLGDYLRELQTQETMQATARKPARKSIRKQKENKNGRKKR
jgi:DNA-binding transcriptional ArsR family regulator